MKQHIEAVLEWSFRILLLALVTAMIAFYHKWRNTPCFSYGDISHTMFPR